LGINNMEYHCPQEFPSTSANNALNENAQWLLALAFLRWSLRRYDTLRDDQFHFCRHRRCRSKWSVIDFVTKVSRDHILRGEVCWFLWW
jgi:hypothetical protein